mgnify:CR=1 FL=1
MTEPSRDSGAAGITPRSSRHERQALWEGPPDDGVDTLAEAEHDLPDLDYVDQWYAGLIQGGVFTSYASSTRAKNTPDIARCLEVPMLRGTVALRIVDVYGNRTLWAGAGV